MGVDGITKGQYGRRLSQDGKPGRPALSTAVRDLMQDMWPSNSTWGSPRMVGALQKIGINVAKSTVETYRPRTRKPSSLTWKAILACRLHPAPLLGEPVVWAGTPGAAAAGGRREEDAPGVFSGLCSGRAGAQMPFDVPIRGKYQEFLLTRVFGTQNLQHDQDDLHLDKLHT